MELLSVSHSVTKDTLEGVISTIQRSNEELVAVREQQVDQLDQLKRQVLALCCAVLSCSILCRAVLSHISMCASVIRYDIISYHILSYAMYSRITNFFAVDSSLSCIFHFSLFLCFCVVLSMASFFKLNDGTYVQVYLIISLLAFSLSFGLFSFSSLLPLLFSLILLFYLFIFLSFFLSFFLFFFFSFYFFQYTICPTFTILPLPSSRPSFCILF